MFISDLWLEQLDTQCWAASQINLQVPSFQMMYTTSMWHLLLTCYLPLKTPCTWFRDGHALSESGPTLQFAALAAKHSGNYTCGLKDVGTLSPPYSLYVEAEEEGLFITFLCRFFLYLWLFNQRSRCFLTQLFMFCSDDSTRRVSSPTHSLCLFWLGPNCN